MKTIYALIAVVACLVAPLLLSSCETTAGGAVSYAPTPKQVGAAAKLLAYKRLADAKTPEKFDVRKARAVAVADALTKVTTEGLALADVASFLTAQFVNDTDARLYIDVALTLLPAQFASITVRNEYLSELALGITQGLTLAVRPTPTS